MSVRPLVEICAYEVETDGEVSDEEVEVLSPDGLPGVEGKRLKLEKEVEVIRKVVDPKLPSEKEVEDHYLMGHVVYRNWCDNSSQTCVYRNWCSLSKTHAILLKRQCISR